MINDIVIRHGKAGRKALMTNNRRRGNIARISNYRAWRRYWRMGEDVFLPILVHCLTHEALHKVLQHRVSITAWRRMDRIDRVRTIDAYRDAAGINPPIPD